MEGQCRKKEKEEELKSEIDILSQLINAERYSIIRFRIISGETIIVYRFPPPSPSRVNSWKLVNGENIGRRRRFNGFSNSRSAECANATPSGLRFPKPTTYGR